MSNQLRDDTSRCKGEAELSSQTTSNKQMGLITVVISITTEVDCTTTTSRTETTESRQVSFTTPVSDTVETGTGVDEDTVTYSTVAGETCTPICSETTESSTGTGEEDTRVYAPPSVDISTENADCKRGSQFPSPVSVTSVEKTHTRTLTERGYTVETASRTGHRRIG